MMPRVRVFVTSRVTVLMAVFCTRPSTESFLRARAARSSRSSSLRWRRSSALRSFSALAASLAAFYWEARCFSSSRADMGLVGAGAATAWVAGT